MSGFAKMRGLKIRFCSLGGDVIHHNTLGVIQTFPHCEDKVGRVQIQAEGAQIHGSVAPVTGGRQETSTTQIWGWMRAEGGRKELKVRTGQQCFWSVVKFLGSVSVRCEAKLSFTHQLAFILFFKHLLWANNRIFTEKIAVIECMRFL